MSINSASEFRHTLILLTLFKVRLSLNRLQQSYRKDEWQDTPQGTKAYYQLQTNEIIFPAGILQNPLYNVKNPPAVNYGALGSIIGHEIIHAFDQVGAAYNRDGVQEDWWTNKTAEGFRNESKCIIQSYNNYLDATKQENG